MAKNKVVLVKESDRAKAVTQSLVPFKSELEKAVRGKRVVIKVNFVNGRKQLSATHVEAVRAFVKFISPFYKDEILVVERGAIAIGEGFANFNYGPLEKEFNLKNGQHASFGYNLVKLFDQRMNLTQAALYSKLNYDKDVFLVSVSPVKTHDTGVVTLSLKNISVGMLKNPSIVHQGYQAFNKDLYLLNKERMADFVVLDATEAMEGAGPGSGTLKKAGWVLASFNSVQADVVATHLMGLDPHQVGYLHYLMEDGLGTTDWDKVEIGPASLEECRSEFEPHPAYQQQLKWKLGPDLKQRAEITIRRLINKIQVK